MSKRLERLLAKHRNTVMTDDERRAQRISFAYGNVSISNPNIIREMVEKASVRVDTEESD
jgi:hypothetical protein